MCACAEGRLEGERERICIIRDERTNERRSAGYRAESARLGAPLFQCRRASRLGHVRVYGGADPVVSFVYRVYGDVENRINRKAEA